MSKKTAMKRLAKAETAACRAPAFQDALVQVDELMRGKQWGEARILLEDLDRQFPDRQVVLVGLVNALEELGDPQALAEALERLSKLAPDDPEVLGALAGAYLQAVYPYLAVREFRRWLRRWPEHEVALEVRKTLADLEPVVASLHADSPLPDAEAFELGALADESRFLTQKGDLRRARHVAEQILRRHPGLPSALNNLTLIAMVEGKLDRAIDHAREALVSDPENAHALANLVVVLVRAGRGEEAGQAAERMRALTPKRDDGWVKIAEALSYLGDDEGVIAGYERARRSGALGDPVNGPVLEHLTAVAMARLGRVGEARYHWGRVPKGAPHYALVEQNLADLKAPVEQRNGPWAFPIQNWVSPSLVTDITALIQRLARGSERDGDGAFGRLLTQHPELAHLVQLLLDRGDPAARSFAIQLAASARSPELLAALRDFALGRRGSDADRLRALGALQELKAVGAGPVRMWQEGEWREIVPLSFEITDEPVQRFPAPIEEVVAKVVGLLRDGRATEALPMLRQALEAAPDDPSLLNNLASAYTMLGRNDEADAITRRIARDYPEYFFGQVGLAQLEARARRTEAAHRILDGLQGRVRYHRSEFVGLCLAQIEVLLVEKNPAGARSWLDLLASVDPEHPSIPRLRAIIKRAR